MLFLILTLIISLAGLVAIELGQARRPRELAAWNDDVERRLLRLRRGSSNRW